MFVPNRGGHDYSDAERFGELVFVTSGSVNRYGCSFMYRACVEAMQESSPADYLLVTSMNVLNAIAAGVFARKHGRLNLLLFHPKFDANRNFQGGRYEPREVDIDALLDEPSVVQNLDAS